MPDHIHMLLSVPPRYSIAMTIGYLKGKSATGSTGSCCTRKGRYSAGASGLGGTA
jgi:REP element-mobilizing transposase RayT